MARVTYKSLLMLKLLPRTGQNLLDADLLMRARLEFIRALDARSGFQFKQESSVESLICPTGKPKIKGFSKVFQGKSRCDWRAP